MSIPMQGFPAWGGALGRIVAAIKAVATAHEHTDSTDSRLQVSEDGDGAKKFSLSLDDSGGNSGIGNLPGGSGTYVTDISAAFSVVGTTMTLTLTLSRKTLTLEPDGTLKETTAETITRTATISGGGCS